jgi:uncharacterized SAM-binding protein YcdF (DUF218 family)
VVVSALWIAQASDPSPAGLIIVLGGGMDRDNRLANETIARVREGVRLYGAGLAPRVHFTGGVPGRGQPGPGDQMRDLAVAEGLPPDRATVENLSESTIQNALFSRPIVGNAAEGPVILVSDGYHLARAWLTFRWAGYGPRIALVAATPFGDERPMLQLKKLGRETLAWWFNPLRVAIWEGLNLVWGPDPARIDLLR